MPCLGRCAFSSYHFPFTVFNSPAGLDCFAHSNEWRTRNDRRNPQTLTPIRHQAAIPRKPANLTRHCEVRRVTPGS
ncbi:MAG: hypothetical protein LBT00_15990 [Spirochaetaceae bacterium]|nr:hypothetical protein [Spirochaetaceae bacterium]